ncbi:hypothetical protein HaLaN_21340, partial [Haematococcus lacustris]
MVLRRLLIFGWRRRLSCLEDALQDVVSNQLTALPHQSHCSFASTSNMLTSAAHAAHLPPT